MGRWFLRVCRNVLGDSTDAQDAFQATFLVLVRRSGSIRRLESLGSWLYGVACRVAARARVDAAKRRLAERMRGFARRSGRRCRVEQGSSTAPNSARSFRKRSRRLPEKYRAVVALCYWQGLTQEQAATQLGCPLGTVRSRLARARIKLHPRLTRRGLAPLAGLVAAALESRSAEAPVSSGSQSLDAIPQSQRVSSNRGTCDPDVASTSVAVLTQSVLRSMFMMKFKTVGVAVVLVGLGAYGASLAAPQDDPRKAGLDVNARSHVTAEKPKSKAQPALVSLGDYVVEPPIC